MYLGSGWVLWGVRTRHQATRFLQKGYASGNVPTGPSACPKRLGGGGLSVPFPATPFPPDIESAHRRVGKI